ncbi:fumarase, class I alpha subunit [Desulfonispora thiosulfatigenes DSM 11270]|uniref:Fumarase, class I alpha subunit n=1 Tax=Desulfonispora thiosulfatigenes DSM 11270 TaxID=656914 RepID=A0A1W1V2L1_DESTI|nr:fumarate hydratase [Desulfonispora thiosulfatigenes]SMB87589.1 fumarase, class I alpha subunit [Desulfonispora thiosulfatigenes DSM 11270]
MKEISVKEVQKEVKRLCMEAAYNLPEDVEKLIREGKEKEESPFGNYCFDKIIENFELARKDQVAMCQDTGLAVIFVELGQDVRIIDGDLIVAINNGVAEGYTDGYLRKSVVNEPIFERKNTGNNTPAVIHTELVPGDKLKIQVVPKGAGSENMGALKMLKPAQGLEGVKDFIIESVTKAGGNPCPPIIVGVGVGGTMEKCTILAKKALARKAGEPNPDPRYAELEKELLEKINKLGIGPQGFGGRVTALAVHIEYYPTHIATLPVAVNLNCHAARHKEVIF